MAEKLLRLAIGFVLIVGAAGLVPENRAIAWGVISDYRTIDSHEVNAAGVICHNDLASDPQTVSIEAGDVLLKRGVGYSTQMTSVQYLLYQELAGGKLNLLDRSPLAMAATEASGWAAFGPYTFENRNLGPKYVVVSDLVWYDELSNPIGGTQVRMKNYEVRIHYPGDTSNTQRTVQSACISPLPPSASIAANAGSAQANLGFSLRYFPSNVTVFIRWEGRASIGSISTTAAGDATGVVRIPAAPMGTHALKWQYDTWTDSATYTIKPRIKVIEGTVKRGQTVNISLRGFAAKEVVRIRWRKSNSWIELGRVTTSSTGSANAYLKVPAWAPNGTASVRGDGAYGRAQTNAVTVNGGTFRSATQPSPLPTSTPTLVPTATATIAPSQTATPAPSPTVAAETPTALPEASPVSNAP